jgi:hypothetical protein
VYNAILSGKRIPAHIILENSILDTTLQASSGDVLDVKLVKTWKKNSLVDLQRVCHAPRDLLTEDRNPHLQPDQPAIPPIL